MFEFKAYIAAAVTALSIAIMADVPKLRSGSEVADVRRKHTGRIDPADARAFRDAPERRNGDAVEIEYFDSGTLGDEIVHMQQVRTGQLDVIPIGSDAVQLDTKFAVFDTPVLVFQPRPGGLCS